MIYHYTKGVHLRLIMADGLQPSSIGLQHGEKAVLWFTTNPHWENTVLMKEGKAEAPSLEEAHRASAGRGEELIRICCDDSVAPYTWKEIKEIASMPPKLAAALYKLAIAVGSRPGEWRATTEAVPADKFRAVDIYDGQAWLPRPADLEFPDDSEVTTMTTEEWIQAKREGREPWRNTLPRRNKIREISTSVLALLRETPEPVVVLGVDEETSEEYLVYGRAYLERCRATNATNTSVEVIRVPIRAATDELECLIAAVTTAKGKHDYIGGPK